MIDFEAIEARSNALALEFKEASPFCHVVLDGFCEEPKIRELLEYLPNPIDAGMGRSRDYVFAKNKFEKGNFRTLSPELEALYQDMTSDRFRKFLRLVTGDDVFVDAHFHGGGLHQGGEGSFLDMHVDFNSHPLRKNWFRNLNIILYLNAGWRPEHGGQLKLRHLERPGETTLVEPVFNRCVIMQTRSHTLHGYDQISFPPGTYRRSIAAYAYTIVERVEAPRTTTWYPDTPGTAKKLLGKHWPKLVRIKNALMGSGTAKNK